MFPQGRNIIYATKKRLINSGGEGGKKNPTTYQWIAVCDLNDFKGNFENWGFDDESGIGGLTLNCSQSALPHDILVLAFFEFYV